MRFKLLGTDIYVSFLFCALVTLMLATDRTGLSLPTLFAIILHEIGHLFAMWVLDCPPKSIRLIPASVQITRTITSRYSKDIWIAIAGPLVNLVLFGTLYFNYLAFKNEITLIYALLNLIIAVFNLLPVAGLDGGTVLYILVAQKSDINKAALTLKIITAVLAAAVFVLAVTLTVRGKVNVSLYIAAIYLFMGVLMKI